MSNEQKKNVPLSKRLRPDVECAPWVIEEVRKLEADTLAAEARIRELEADARRYRWLRDKSEYGDDFYLSIPFESPRDTFKPHEVDEAIDAALTEHKENQG